MRTSRFLRAFWALARLYWTSPQRGRGLILLATVVGLVLGVVWMEVQFNTWNREFYNTFESRDQAEFFRQLGMFSLLALIWIITRVYRLYFLQMLQIEWRTWLTEHFLADWMRDQAHYRMQLLDRGTDNPDQRIADDLRLFTGGALGLGLGLFSSVVTLVSFVAVLWSISGALTVPLGQREIVIPGYMVWAAVGYALVGSLLTHWVGRRLIGLNFQQERYEAEQAVMGDLTALDTPATRVRLKAGQGRTGADMAAFLEEVRRDAPDERFWSGVKRIVADGNNLDVEWFDPVVPRPLDAGSTTVECHLFDEAALAEAERRRNEVEALGRGE